MKRLLLVVLLSGMVAGCDAPSILAPEIKKEHPTVNLPLDLRQGELAGAERRGVLHLGHDGFLAALAGPLPHGRLDSTELR